MSSVVLYFCLAGMAILTPGINSPSYNWWGFRFCVAVLIVPVYLYVGNVLLGLPLSLLTWAFAAIAVAGFGKLVIQRSFTWENCRSSALHPIFILPLLALAVALTINDLTYLPYPGDETGSWLRYARQVYLADAYWSDKLIYHHGAYTTGWPMMIAFANIFDSQYVDRNGIVFLFLMHVGVLGFTFDLTRFVALRSGVSENKTANLIAWLLVLVLLAVEASWILFPTFQLIEKPLLYAYLAGLLLVLASQYCEFDRTRLAAFLGLVFAAGYLIKVAFLLFAVILGVVWLIFYWRTFREQNQITGFLSWALIKKGAGWAVLMLMPMIIIAATWSKFRVGAECFAAPWEYLTNPSQLFSDYSRRVAGVITDAMISYGGQYKVPLTLAGGAVLAAALTWNRMRWFVVIIGILAMIYMLAAHMAYYTCHSPFGETGLQSFQRYLRPNLRFVHFFGIIIAVYFIIEKFGNSGFAKNILKSSLMTDGMALGVIILLGFQAYKIHRSFIDIDTRQFQDEYVRSSIVNIKSESEALMALIRARNLNNPKVSIIAQGQYAVETNLAQYFGIKSHRGGEYFNYTPVRPFSWGEKKTNSFMKETTPAKLIAWWMNFDIIWPIKSDPWIKAVLANLVQSQNCLNNLEQFFLFNSNNGKLTCIPKQHSAEN